MFGFAYMAGYQVVLVQLELNPVYVRTGSYAHQIGVEIVARCERRTASLCRFAAFVSCRRAGNWSTLLELKQPGSSLTLLVARTSIF
jgi:hypothetical protein